MIGGWELATKAGHRAIGLRRTLGHLRIRDHIENRRRDRSRAIELRTCPRCDAVFPAATFCLECGTELQVRDFPDEGPAPDHPTPDRLAASGLITLALGVNATLLSWAWPPYLLLIGASVATYGAASLSVALLMRRWRLGRAIAEQDRQLRRTVSAAPPPRRRPWLSARGWVVLLLATILLVPPAIVWFHPSRVVRRSLKGGKRGRDGGTTELPAVPESQTAGDDESSPLGWRDDPTCAAVQGQLAVHARYPAGREERLAIVVDGREVGTTPWQGDVDAGLVEVAVGGLTYGVVVPAGGSTVLLDSLSVVTPADWVPIPGGEYEMGSSSGYAFHFPPHDVSVPTFEMWRTEVTVEQYRRCVDAGNCLLPLHVPGDGWSGHDRDRRPITHVMWEDAAAFCAWVGGRLPSESEWEYAARGGGHDIDFPWGDAPATCERVVMAEDEPGCGRLDTWEVCSRPAGNSAHGLCDMSGNVWEWVQDSFSYWYLSSPEEWADGRDMCLWWAPPETGYCPSTCDEARTRWGEPPIDGGAWECPDAHARVLRGGSYRSSTRDENAIHLYISDEVGFRCARDLASRPAAAAGRRRR